MTPTNRSILRAFSILRTFHSEDGWVSISEISRRAGLPFASTYRLLQTLDRTGAVEKGNGGAYRLGFLIAALSQNVDIDDSLYHASRPLMTGLSTKLNVSTFLGRLKGDMVTFVCRVLTPNSRQKAFAVGSQSPAHSMALGRVLLSSLPPEYLQETIQNYNLVQRTPHTITNRYQLVSELAAVGRQGFAIEREQAFVGLGCVAVPIHDQEGRVFAAMSASEEVQKLTPERVQQLRHELTSLALDVRRKVLPDTQVFKTNKLASCEYMGTG
jgi:DNA-binding IclR family transcriptional regulator